MVAAPWGGARRSERQDVGEKRAGRTRAGLRVRFRFVFSAMAAASLVLGFLGLRELVGGAGEGPAPSLLDLAYWDLQLFVLGSSPLDSGRDLPVTLEIARFLAPAATAYALFITAHALLRSQVEMVRARRSRGHTVVCGSEPAVLFLARRLAEERRRVVLIDPARSGTAAEWVPPPGILVVAGDPRDSDVLRRAAAHQASEVMACTADSAFNAEVVLAMDALGVTESVTCYAEVDDRDLCAAMVARRLSSGRRSGHTVEYFSRHDRAARRLVDRSPLVAPEPGTVPGADTPAVLVAGTGPLARALVAELARRWHREREGVNGGDEPSPLPVSVLGAGADVSSVRARLPLPAGALDLDARSIDLAAVAEAEDLHVGGRTPTHVFVCLDDDAAAIRLGLVAADLLAGSPPRVVVAVAHGTVFGRVLGEPDEALPSSAHPRPTSSSPDGGSGRGRPDTSRLILHNVIDAVYAPEAVRRGMVEDIARSAHDTYRAAARSRGETPETNPSMVPWGELPERLQDANRAQAADIGNKLAAIGCAAVPATVGDRPFVFEPDELEMLSRLEHERWVRTMLADGWTRGPGPDPDRKHHPDIVAWEELTDVGRDKDRSAVRAIPGQLRAAGFSIVRVARSAGQPDPGGVRLLS